MDGNGCGKGGRCLKIGQVQMAGEQAARFTNGNARARRWTGLGDRGRGHRLLVMRDAVRIVVMVRMLAHIAGMVVVMRRDLSRIFRERAWAAGAFVRTLRHRLVHDGSDRPRTTSALRAAAETAIDLAGHARRIGPDHGTNLVIRQDVTGADDHIRRFSVRGHPVSKYYLVQSPFVCKKEIQLSNTYLYASTREHTQSRRARPAGASDKAPQRAG
jgi:hypothetical protein